MVFVEQKTEVLWVDTHSKDSSLNLRPMTIRYNCVSILRWRKQLYPCIFGYQSHNTQGKIYNYEFQNPWRGTIQRIQERFSSSGQSCQNAAGQNSFQRHISNLHHYTRVSSVVLQTCISVTTSTHSAFDCSLSKRDMDGFLGHLPISNIWKLCVWCYCEQKKYCSGLGSLKELHRLVQMVISASGKCF